MTWEVQGGVGYFDKTVQENELKNGRIGWLEGIRIFRRSLHGEVDLALIK